MKRYAVYALSLVALGAFVSACSESTSPTTVRPQYSVGTNYHLYTSYASGTSGVSAAAQAWNDYAFNPDLIHSNGPGSMPSITYGSAGNQITVNFDEPISGHTGWCASTDQQNMTIHMISANTTCPQSGGVILPRVVSDVAAVVMHELTHIFLSAESHSSTTMWRDCVSRVTGHTTGQDSALNQTFCPLEVQYLYYRQGSGVRSTAPSETYDLADGLNLSPAAQFDVNAYHTYKVTNWTYRTAQGSRSLASLPSLSWSVDNSAVAEITHHAGDSAVVKGKAVGTTSITATISAENQYVYIPFTPGEAAITVGAVDSIVISPRPVTINSGGPYEISVTATAYRNGSPLTGVSFAWTTGNGSVAATFPSTGATVDVVGNHSGSTIVYATVIGVVGSANVNVSCPGGGFCP